MSFSLLFFFLTTQAQSRYSNFSWIAVISFPLLCQFGSTHIIVATILEVARFLPRFRVHQPPVQTYRPQCFGYHAVSIRRKSWWGKGSWGELFFLSPPIPFTNFTWWKMAAPYVKILSALHAMRIPYLANFLKSTVVGSWRKKNQAVSFRSAVFLLVSFPA